MQRRIQNRQGEFTFAPLPTSLIENAGSDTLEIATIFMSDRNQLPYFFGAKHVAHLASSNVDQFLSLSAALFDLLLNTGSLGRRRRQLPASAQHKLIVGRIFLVRQGYRHQDPIRARCRKLSGRNSKTLSR